MLDVAAAACVLIALASGAAKSYDPRRSLALVDAPALALAPRAGLHVCDVPRAGGASVRVASDGRRALVLDESRAYEIRQRPPGARGAFVVALNTLLHAAGFAAARRGRGTALQTLLSALYGAAVAWAERGAVGPAHALYAAGMLGVSAATIAAATGCGAFAPARVSQEPPCDDSNEEELPPSVDAQSARRS